VSHKGQRYLKMSLTKLPPRMSWSKRSTVCQLDVITYGLVTDLGLKILVLSDGVNNTENPYGALRALRKVRHERMQRRLFILDKEARLRSGTRGLQARKALVEYEKAVAESAARFVPPLPMISSPFRTDTTQEMSNQKKTSPQRHSRQRFKKRLISSPNCKFKSSHHVWLMWNRAQRRS